MDEEEEEEMEEEEEEEKLSPPPQPNPTLQLEFLDPPYWVSKEAIAIVQLQWSEERTSLCIYRKMPNIYIFKAQ